MKLTKHRTRARAKKWFLRSHHTHEIVSYDGKFTFLTRPLRPGVVHVRCARFGLFVFSDEPGFKLIDQK